MALARKRKLVDEMTETSGVQSYGQQSTQTSHTASNPAVNKPRLRVQSRFIPTLTKQRSPSVRPASSQPKSSLTRAVAPVKPMAAVATMSSPVLDLNSPRDELQRITKTLSAVLGRLNSGFQSVQEFEGRFFSIEKNLEQLQLSTSQIHKRLKCMEAQLLQLDPDIDRTRSPDISYLPDSDDGQSEGNDMGENIEEEESLSGASEEYRYRHYSEGKDV